MPANIAKVLLTNTFSEWVTRSNSTIDEVNTLLNGNYTKDLGSLTVNTNITITTNGTLQLNKTGTSLINQGNTQFQKNLELGGISNVESKLTAAHTTANSAYTAANNAANTATVSANGGSVRIANTLNFVNTSSIAVSVVPSATAGQANISFSTVGSGITSITAGAGLAASPTNPITGSGTISANSASTTVVGVVQLSDSVTTTSSILAATPTAAKTAYDKGITAHNQANTGYTQANAAYTQANTAYTQANAAYTQANTAYARANQAFGNVTTRTTTSGVAYYNDTNNVASASGVTYDANHGGGLKFSGVTYDTPIASISASTSYADNAAGKVILAGSASDITVTFATATSSGFATTVVRTGTGNVIIAAGAGVTKVNSASFTTSNIAGNNEAATVVYTSTNQILVLGSIT